MSLRGSLARRLVVSYVLMTLIVAGLFSLTVIFAVDYTEDYYAAQYMRQELAELLAQIDTGKPFQIDQDQLLYIRGPDGKPALPEWLGEIVPGFQEAFLDGVEHHALAEERDGSLYVLVQNQAEFEQRENMLRLVVLCAFFLSLVAAAILGRSMARRVIAPLTRLAQRVQSRDPLLTDAPAPGIPHDPDEVDTLAATFDATLGQLREALERERFFTSDVSHELRTPLMVIASSCDLLLAQGTASGRQAEQIGRIRHACEEMRELVETFLHLARRPGEESHESVATVSKLAREQLDRLAADARERGLQLALFVEAEDPQPYSASFLRAVLSNLLRNAIHYTDRGYIHLRTRRGGFSVIDSGAGILPEQRKSYFLPFVRGEASRGDGLGLGLSLVERICQHQGWHIHLESRPEGGCEFRIDLSLE